MYEEAFSYLLSMITDGRGGVAEIRCCFGRESGTFVRIKNMKLNDLFGNGSMLLETVVHA